MEKRSLGRTGHHSTVVAFGTAALGRVTQDVADVAVELILEYGVNHIDIAPTYGQAMERMAPWMPKIRDQVFLGAKTRERTKGQAWENIRSCMSRLAVESFELFQLHSVGDMEALDQVTGNGGALEALIEMREQGLTRWIGITGHGPDVPRVQLEALERFDFDTIMFPVSASMFRSQEYREDALELLDKAASRNLGGAHDQDDRPRRLGRPRSGVHHLVRPASRAEGHRQGALVGPLQPHAYGAERR